MWIAVSSDFLVSWELRVGRNAAIGIRSNPGSSTDQFDREGRKIKVNRKKKPKKCPFQGTNLKVTKPEKGGGKEKEETCSIAVPREVGFFWGGGGGGGALHWRSSPRNLDRYRGKIQFLTPRRQVPRRPKNAPVGQRNVSSNTTRKEAQGPSFHLFLAAVLALCLFVNIEAPQCQGGLHFLSLWHC